MRPEESYLNQPVRSLQTMLQTISKFNHSVPYIIPDGIYGKNTANAVRIFQANNGLIPTGIVNYETWDKIRNVYDEALIEQRQAAPLQISMDPSEVLNDQTGNPYLYIVQAMLTYLSTIHSNIPAPGFTGRNDPLTALSVAKFQSLNGIKPTGEVNKQTWAALTDQFSLNAELERINQS